MTENSGTPPVQPATTDGGPEEDYRRGCRLYVDDPKEAWKEPRKKNVFLWILLGVSVVGAVVIGCAYDEEDTWRIRPIVWWEVIAVFDTIVLLFVYYRTLIKEADAERVTDLKYVLKLVVPAWFLTGVFVLAAGVFLVLSQLNEKNRICFFFVYLVLLLASFAIFTFLDLKFASLNHSFQKKRLYWALAVFADAPAAAGLLVLLIYSGLVEWLGRGVPEDVLSGAVVMQMLIADALFLIIYSNAHNRVLIRLCKNVSMP